MRRAPAGATSGGWEVSRKRVAEHDVDLDQLRQRRGPDQREHDQVHDVAGVLDLGALVALDDVLDHQRVQAEAARRAASAPRGDASSRSTQTRGLGIARAPRSASSIVARLRGPPSATRRAPRTSALPSRACAPQRARAGLASLGRRLRLRHRRRWWHVRALGAGRAAAGWAGSPTSSTSAATRNSPARIDAACADAQVSSTSITSGSASGRPWSAGGSTASRAAWSVRTTLSALDALGAEPGEHRQPDGHAGHARHGHRGAGHAEAAAARAPPRRRWSGASRSARTPARTARGRRAARPRAVSADGAAEQQHPADRAARGRRARGARCDTRRSR